MQNYLQYLVSVSVCCFIFIISWLFLGDSQNLAVKTGQNKYPEKLKIQEKNIFQRASNLKYFCKKYSNLTGVSPAKKLNFRNLYSSDNLTLTELFKISHSPLIKYEFVSQTLFCFPAKTGTTNWSLLGAALRRNTTFDKYRETYEHDFVYKDLLTLAPLESLYEKVKQHAKSYPLVTSEDLMKRSKLWDYVNKLLKEYHVEDSIKFSHADFLNALYSDRYKVQNSILLVRHPLVRLYSCWAHRFSTVSSLHAKLFRKQINYIKTKLMFKTDLEPRVKHQLVSFTGFLRFVSSKVAHTEYYLNVHWQSIYDRCKPCKINYNLVVQTETANQDAISVLKYLDREEIGEFPSAYGSNNQSKNNLEDKHGVLVKQTGSVEDRILGIQEFYRQWIPKRIILQVFEFYKLDFLLYGYTLDGYV